MERAAFVLLALTGCGRIAFDPGGDAGTSDSSSEVDSAALGAWRAPTPVNLSTANSDDDPSLTDDLLELYFNRDGSTIMRAFRQSANAAWETPAAVAELNVGSATLPEISGNGLGIYWASARTGTVGNLDIWHSERNARGLTAFPNAVNSFGVNTIFDEYGAAATSNNLRMVISSNASGSLDLYETSRVNTGASFPTPTPIAGLDTPGTEDEPFLSADGLTLYYTGPTLHIFVTQRTDVTQPFTTGTAIPELMSTGTDRDPWVSPDGRYMMFSSDRDGPTRLYETSR